MLDATESSEWSESFEQYVSRVDGEGEAGRRVLVRLATGELIDLPESFVRPVPPDEAADKCTTHEGQLPTTP